MTQLGDCDVGNELEKPDSRSLTQSRLLRMQCSLQNRKMVTIMERGSAYLAWLQEGTQSLTFGTHAQRGLQYLVCVSVTQHLTFDVIIHATNDTNLLSGG